MAVRQREYLLSVNKYNEPSTVEGTDAIALLLIRLILMNPGSDPLHPEMGVGLAHYRYGMDLDKLCRRIQDQIETYLPNFQNADVTLVRDSATKLVNIYISTGNVTYIYDSSQMPIPIKELSDMKN